MIQQQTCQLASPGDLSLDRNSAAEFAGMLRIDGKGRGLEPGWSDRHGQIEGLFVCNGVASLCLTKHS